MRLERSTYPQVEAYLEGNDTVLMLFGSTEQHGKHNPLGTDSFAPQKLSELIEKDLPGLLIAPILPFGSSPRFVEFPGTFNLGDQLYLAVVKKLCENLYDQGFRHFVFLNGHGGNSNSLDFVCDDLHAKYNDVIAMHSEWWKVLPFISQYKCDDHGGKHETSFVLDVDPDLVHMDRAETVPRASLTEKLTYTDKFRFDGVNIPMCGVTLDKLTPRGNYGARAEEATAELGAEMSQIYVDYCVELVKELKRVYL